MHMLVGKERGFPVSNLELGSWNGLLEMCGRWHWIMYDSFIRTSIVVIHYYICCSWFVSLSVYLD